MLILNAILVFQESDFTVGHNGLQRLILTAPGVLFPIMAFFIWLDTRRFRVYVPLFTAGKCINIAALLSWLVITGRLPPGNGERIASIELYLLTGELISMAAILLILRDFVKITETQVLEGK